jgi:serine/threonine protein kinase
VDPPVDDSEDTLIDSEDTLIDEGPTPTAAPSVADYTATLRRVLGAEFELVAPIGEGGFARVYKAWDHRLDRTVAIKVIRPDLAGVKAIVDSFRHEGVALAKLRHPSIVPIYDIRESEGLIYYVMPFVEGETLGGKLERLRRLPPSETQRILTELCDALGAAHRAKMVHRDIKPANVILEGNLQKALLMDFGIAMALTENVEETGEGPVVGTPTYMSPEQAIGRDEIDHRSDLYSLGVMGYRMLTGKLPFDGPSPREILTKHVKEKPEHIRRLNPSVPKNFADAIMKCLEKDPWDRFGTAMDLWTELQTVSFFPARTDPSPSSSSSGTPIKVVLGIAGIGLIAGFLTGRVAYQDGGLLTSPPPSSAVAEALVAGWLDNPGGDATSAFEPNATVIHLAADPHESPLMEMSPTRIPQYESITTRMAGVAGNPLDVRAFGDVAIVSGSYEIPESACGKAWFVLKARSNQWRVVHARLQDIAAACEPEARDPPQ